ncbi:MAG: hypothetical protein ACM3X9_00140 [Bacillota bacterium]
MYKPLDLQTILPRTMDLQRIQQVQNSRPVVDQQEYSREALKQSQIRQERVEQNEASAEGNRVHDDAFNNEKNRSRRYRRYSLKRKPQAVADTPEQADDSERGQHIDIKI